MAENALPTTPPAFNPNYITQNCRKTIVPFEVVNGSLVIPIFFTLSIKNYGSNNATIQFDGGNFTLIPNDSISLPINSENYNGFTIVATTTTVRGLYTR